METTKVSSTPKRQNSIRLTTKRLSQKRTGVIVTTIQHPDQPTKKEQRQKQLRPIVEKGKHGPKNNPTTLNDEILNEGPDRLTIVIDKKAEGINQTIQIEEPRTERKAAEILEIKAFRKNSNLRE